MAWSGWSFNDRLGIDGVEWQLGRAEHERVGRGTRWL